MRRRASRPTIRRSWRGFNRQGFTRCAICSASARIFRRFLNALDIATSASTGEAFPNAVAEAMACEIPCVATDVGDSRFIVGETGIVVAPKACGCLAQAWKELLEAGPEARRRLGLAARERIEQNFGLAAVIKQYQDLYSQVAVDTSAKPPRTHRWKRTNRSKLIPCCIEIL